MLTGIGLLSIIAGYTITRMKDMQKTLKYSVNKIVIYIYTDKPLYLPVCGEIPGVFLYK